MRKVVLTQRFQFYLITPFKDYSKLTNKVQSKVHDDLNLELQNVDFFDTLAEVDSNQDPISAFLREKPSFKIHNKKELKKKNTKYFYSDKDNGEVVKLDHYWPKIPTFYTTSEKHLLKHFGRPFSSVSVVIHERNITIDNDSISVRFYTHRKNRGVNNKFYKKSKSAVGFKINLKTGNIISYEGGSALRIRQNSFKHIQTVLAMFFSRTNGNIISDHFGEDRLKDHPVNLEAKRIFDDEEFVKVLTHLFLSNYPHNERMISNKESIAFRKVYSLLSELFVSIKEIKVPNNYEKLLLEAYPTKVYLKKNDNKLIASVLDRIGIKSKSTIRLLHKYPDLDIKKLILLTRYFGYRDLHKYIHNINELFFQESSKNDMDISLYSSVYDAINNKYEYDIKDSERKCLLKLINEFFEHQGSRGYTMKNTIVSDERVYQTQFNTFNDHLDLLMRIRTHLPDVEMRAMSLSEFHNEHLEFSKIDRAIKKGFSIKYMFEERLIKHVEEPIHFRDENGELIETYYPVLLTIDAEYTEEGAHMHHCVATYADKERSVIVSVREGSKQGSERVTCEFDTSDKSCVQAKYFCNAVPPERFTFALEKIKHRMKIFRGSIKSLSKEKIPLIINGVQIEQKEPSPFDFLQLF